MNWQQPWFLLLALPWAVWVRLEWSRSRRQLLAMRALTALLIILALAQPQIALDGSKMAVALLVDTSASLPDQSLRDAGRLVHQIEGERGRHEVTVVPFSSEIRAVGEKDRDGRAWSFQRAAGNYLATDLERAVRTALASLPAGRVPRLVLMSDGRENRGSVIRAAWQARDRGVPIDTIPLAGRKEPEARLVSVSLPALAFTGEKFPVDVVVQSPRTGKGTFEVSAEGKPLGSSQVSLQPGDNRLRLQVTLGVPGAIELRGVLESEDLGRLQFERVMHLRRPRLLWVSQDPAGTADHALGVLRAAHFEIDDATSIPAAGLSGFHLVVLNNIDLEAMFPEHKAALEDHVRRGGGLLVVGGERNVYKEGKTVEDALDRVLPAKLAPPRSPEGTCVVLILDKSSSMEGRKMELARLAAIGVIDNIRPQDQVGVLIFDNSFQWAVPIRKADDKNTIKRLIAGVMPDGGTQIAPALNEAYRKISNTSATVRHVVLLTDGISEEGDSLNLAKEAAEKRVTISTVGLGQDVNRSYLERVAVLAKGRSYFLIDPSGLEQILIKDVKEHTGTTAVEKPLVPQVVKELPVLDGVDMKQAPPLKGYVRFTAKPTADTVLRMETDRDRDPLYTTWQFGLGRSAVWASDAKSRWAEAWVGWKDFDRFWTNLTQDLLPQAQVSEAVARWEPATQHLVAEYRLAPNVPEPKSPPELFVLGPDGFRQPLPVQKAAVGVYRGEVPLGERQGLFRVRPLADSETFPEVGLYRDQEELSQYGTDEALLQQISSFTGGRFRPAATEVFDPGGRSMTSSLQLWPALLGGAILLSLIELLWRKLRGV